MAGLTCSIYPLAVYVDGGREVCIVLGRRAAKLRASLSCGQSLQLMPHWNFWPQTLQSRVPTPAFLSSFTVTDFSWLQKRHVKTLGRGSFCGAHGTVRPLLVIVVVRLGMGTYPFRALRLARTLLALAHG